MNLTITEMINEIMRIQPTKYERSILYRKSKEYVTKIYKRVKRKKV